MEELPPELTQIICSNLTPTDLKSVRLTSKQLAASSACYLLPKVFVFDRKESFNELKEIAQHPIFSKHVTTLVYDPTHLNDFKNNFGNWNKARPNTCYVPRWVDFEPYQKTTKGPLDNRSDRAMQRAKSQYMQAYDQCPVDPAMVEKMWNFYQTLVDEQGDGSLRKLKVETMKLAFSLCPKLDHIIVGDDQHLFSKNRARLFKDIPMFSVGRRPDTTRILNDVLAAIASTGRSMRRLTIPLTSMGGKQWSRLLETSLPDAITETLQNLRVFTLSVHEDFTMLDSQYDAAGQYIFDGLQNASQLEVLKISFSAANASDRRRRPANLWWSHSRICTLIRGIHWPTLHTVTFVRCCDLEDLFVEFLLHHKQSLRALAFKDCRLLTGDWTSLFTRIAGRLPCLKQVRLAGSLYSDVYVEFYLPTQGRLTTSIALELQTFIIEGGALPPNSSPGGLPVNIVQEPFDDDDDDDEEQD